MLFETVKSTTALHCFCKRSGKDTDKNNFNYANLLLEWIITVKKKLYFKYKIVENNANP